MPKYRIDWTVKCAEDADYSLTVRFKERTFPNPITVGEPLSFLDWYHKDKDLDIATHRVEHGIEYSVLEAENEGSRWDIFNICYLIIESNIRGGEKKPPYDSLIYAYIKQVNGSDLSIFPDFELDSHWVGTPVEELADCIIQDLYLSDKCINPSKPSVPKKLQFMLSLLKDGEIKDGEIKNFEQYMEERDEQRMERCRGDVESKINKACQKVHKGYPDTSFLKNLDAEYSQGVLDYIRRYLGLESK